MCMRSRCRALIGSEDHAGCLIECRNDPPPLTVTGDTQIHLAPELASTATTKASTADDLSSSITTDSYDLSSNFKSQSEAQTEDEPSISNQIFTKGQTYDINNHLLSCMKPCLEENQSKFINCIYKNCVSSQPLTVWLEKRQGDKMHTCIEAKCAGLPQPEYGYCFYNKCLMKKEVNPQLISEVKRQGDAMHACVEAKCAGLSKAKYGSCVFLQCSPYLTSSSSIGKRTSNEESNNCKAKCAGKEQSDYGICIFQNCILTVATQVPTISIEKRQRDRMHTCIEAKCAGLPLPNYGRCLVSECLNPLKKKYSSPIVKKRQGDQMNTCIEAKCAGLSQTAYAHCLWDACISKNGPLLVANSGKRTESFSQVQKPESSMLFSADVPCTSNCDQFTHDTVIHRICMQLNCNNR